jgi:hypothetical protein
MDRALRAKFAPGSRLAERLVATGTAFLVEGNRWCDNHWGDCRCGRTRCAQPGLNVLGRMLMALRRELATPDTSYMSPLAEMTGIPGVCRIPASSVPAEFVNVIATHRGLSGLMDTEAIQTELALVLEMAIPWAVRCQAARNARASTSGED